MTDYKANWEKFIMNNSLNILNRKIIKCTKCDRLVKFRKKIAKEKINAVLCQNI